MAPLPDALVWSLIRKQNRFLTKRDRVQFSSEAGNLTNVSNFRSSGLANSKSVDVSVVGADDDEKVQLTFKAKKKSCKPSAGNVRVPLRNDPRRSERQLRQAMTGTYYRADLQSDALARYARQQKSLIRKKANVTYEAKSRRR